MQTKETIIILIIIFLSSCSSKATKDYMDLAIKDDIHAVVVNKTKSISILTGNGDYSISIDDETIVSAIYSRKDEAIIITGEKIGKTNILINDNISNQEKILQIKVISALPYLSLYVHRVNIEVVIDDTVAKEEIYADIERNNLFNINTYVTIVSDRNIFYNFNSEENLINGKYVVSGIRELTPDSQDKTVGNLTLTNENRVHMYSLNPSSYNVLRSFLCSEKFETDKVKLRDGVHYRVHLEQDLTDYYKSRFSELEEAHLIIESYYVDGSELEIPAKLL